MHQIITDLPQDKIFIDVDNHTIPNKTIIPIKLVINNTSIIIVSFSFHLYTQFILIVNINKEFYKNPLVVVIRAIRIGIKKIIVWV